MPSGSRAGSSGGSGGGSHFGGGSSGGGFGRGGGHGSSHRGFFRGRPGRRGGISVFYFGRHRYMPASAYSKLNRLSVLFAVLAFFLMFAGIITWNVSQGIDIVYNDYRYYQQMILDAEANPEQLQVEGIITSKKRDENTDKWFLNYSFVADDGSTVEGYTYSIYTWDEVKEFQVGSTILLAVESPYTTRESDSVNMDYKNYPLEKDGEYQKLKKMKTICIVADCAIGAGCLATAVGIVVILVKKMQKTDEVESPTQASIPVKKTRYCRYCGARLDDTRPNCSQCGSAVEKE